MPAKGFRKCTRPDGMLFDEIDRALVESRTWHIGSRGYVRSTVRTEDRCYGLLLAREIMQAPYFMDVDHINGNKLDNRRQNLRIVTHAENLANRHGATKVSKTGVRGVVPHPRGGYRAQCSIAHRTINLGRFTNLEDARQVRLQHEAASHKNPLNLATA